MQTTIFLTTFVPYRLPFWFSETCLPHSTPFSSRLTDRPLVGRYPPLTRVFFFFVFRLALS